MEDEIFYKFIINQYIDLFNKSIYDKKKIFVIKMNYYL